MAKLRKTLGRAGDPAVQALMRQMETQSEETLKRWCIQEAERAYLPLCGQGEPLRAGLEAAQACAEGRVKLKEIRPALRAAMEAARGATEPTEQAAARAVATAAGSVQTLTNALGMAFYGAAATAYAQLGTSATAEAYDAAAEAEFVRLRRSLCEVSIEGEANPARLDWNC